MTKKEEQFRDYLQSECDKRLSDWSGGKFIERQILLIVLDKFKEKFGA